MSSATETVHTLPPVHLARATRQDLARYFDNTWNLYETLMRTLKSDEVFYKVPDPLRRPLIFYLGHPAVFYINKLVASGLLKERINPYFEQLFAVGVDEMQWDAENDVFTWPEVADVWAYRKQAYAVIQDLIANAPYEAPITWDSPWWALPMGMEHDRIHLETSSVLIRQLAVEDVVRPRSWRYGPSRGKAPANRMIQVPAGRVVVGKDRDFPSYGWDNEYGHEVRDVPPFEASQFLVTQAEYLEFVLDKGYERRELWDEEGWEWRSETGARHPRFWVPDGHCFRYRAMFDVIDMPWDWPVEVCWLEAHAFCQWKGKGYRLIREAEHHRLRDAYEADPADSATIDHLFRSEVPGNMGLKYGSSTPVDFYPPTRAGFYDVFGNVWEGTEEHFHPLPGFQTHPYYDDFSTPCFDGLHNMIMGGSWISTGDESSIFARFHFRRHFYQHLGFRLVRSL